MYLMPMPVSRRGLAAQSLQMMISIRSTSPSKERPRQLSHTPTDHHQLEMILPSEAPSNSSYDGEGRDQTLPPSYQESVPPSQLLPRERPSDSVYAPSVPSRSDPPRNREREPGADPEYPDEKNAPGFPDPRTPTERAYSDPYLSSSKEKEKERDGPPQSPFNIFSSMIWGNTSTASTSSRTQNPASTSHASTTQDPLNPAPAAFTRPAPKNYAYLPFQPMTMLGISSNLADGFPVIPPPINPEDDGSAGKANAQHPFVSHDVTEEDWLK